ncbi:MAG: response regulator [Jaaginema sp. PMC 1079.18]|nr:response regulator [Jaaginema sp. PMC 1080.18]MEC4851466.1 response regulator [Jaaginema sp. PMC 1079.18]MEC4867011.1 response regulator [Jaaginema sp. PMC 1078.18]
MTRLRFLLLEDNPLDAEVTKVTLTDSGLDIAIQIVETRSQFITALKTQTFDLILADYALPGFDGYEALTITRDRNPDIPFIFSRITSRRSRSPRARDTTRPQSCPRR